MSTSDLTAQPVPVSASQPHATGDLVLSIPEPDEEVSLAPTVDRKLLRPDDMSISYIIDHTKAMRTRRPRQRMERRTRLRRKAEGSKNAKESKLRSVKFGIRLQILVRFWSHKILPVLKTKSV